LVIELDGPIHKAQAVEDATRQEELAARGFRVLRFTNEEVLQDLTAVTATIEANLTPGPSPTSERGS
jgi:leucyl-tRNA synthetase